MLDRKSPIAGRGWGCLQCDLSLDGATAVLCDACVGPVDPRTGLPLDRDVRSKLRFACRGWPGEDGRVPIDALVGAHAHDRSRHPQEDWPDDDDG